MGRPKHGSQRVKKWVALRRSEPGLYIFTFTTACLSLSVVWVLEKRVDCWH